MLQPYVPTPYVLNCYEPVPECGCWLWTGVWEHDGYGRVAARWCPDGKRRSSPKAHRVFYLHYIGPIPAGLSVMHKCDTPACVNPAHLMLGTNADNIADKMAKGRHKFSRRKLTQEIKDLILSKTMSTREISHKYKISTATIKSVRRKPRSKTALHGAGARGGES